MLLDAAQDRRVKPWRWRQGEPNNAAVMRQEATVLAMLAIAEEIAQAREYIGGVKMALEDNDGFGAGLHLHYISDWLKDISERR
jgi:hypothetical protein